MSANGEPWANHGTMGCVTASGKYAGEFRQRTNAERAVQCVNALAGIPDPAAELSRLRACEVALRFIMENGEDEMPFELFERAQSALATKP